MLPAFQPPEWRRVNALPWSWTVLLINYSCSTDFSAGYPATSVSILAQLTPLFTEKIMRSFYGSHRSSRVGLARTEFWLLGMKPSECLGAQRRISLRCVRLKMG